MANSRAWFYTAAGYQIYPKSFQDSNHDGIGDLGGITSRLDYIKGLGIDFIWICPFFESPDKDNGYDVSDYRSIKACYGTMRDFERLAQGIHQRGMKLVLDLVLNHTSNQHPWFIKSKHNTSHQDWYIWREGKVNREGELLPPNNWTGFFGGSAWTYVEERQQFYLHLFTPYQPDLNWANEEVRKEMADIMNFWIEKGADGFRLDAVSYLDKPDDFSDASMDQNGKAFPMERLAAGKKLGDYFRELRGRLIHSDVLLIGEMAGVGPAAAIKMAPPDQSQLNMVFQFEVNDLDGGETFKYNHRRIEIKDLKRVLFRWQRQLYLKSWNTLFYNNHDEPRIVSRIFIDNTKREAQAKALACALYFLQGTPFIYQGEELGMVNSEFESEEELRDIAGILAFRNPLLKEKYGEKELLHIISQKGRDSARTPMQWDDSKYAGFSNQEPWIKVNPDYVNNNLKAQLNSNSSVYHFYKNLLQVRKDPIFWDGKVREIEDIDQDVIAYIRENKKERVMVIVNLSDSAKPFTLAEEFKRGEVLLR
ncbi:MAG: alpha-glucosidase, partial [Erysipelotrichaceae bacterium]|nr:alpha-glucosidase [Erysipelotrichaceae bacterium]